MEIRKVVNCIVPFREIVQGDVFLFDREHYMRVEKFGNCVNDRFNAVNLFTGGITYFTDNEKVSPVDNCYLAIE